MTAYMERVQRLAGDQPSLRVRSRSRFEPVSPGSEPPWERAVPDAALSPFRTESPFQTESPFESDDEAGTRPSNMPLTGGIAGKRPVPAVPADGHPDTAGARPWSSLSSERSLGSSPVPSASAVPEHFSGLGDARRRPRAPGSPPTGSEEPPAAMGPPAHALPASADPGTEASGQTRPDRHALPGDLSHRDEHPSVPDGPRVQTDPADRASGSTSPVLAPASPRPRPADPAAGSRSAAGLAVPATRGSRFEADPEPAERVSPDQPVLPMDRVPATPPGRRREPADVAGPLRWRFSPPAGRAGLVEPAAGRAGLAEPTAGRARLAEPTADRAGLAEPAADDRAIAPRPVHPDVGRRTDARAGPDEVTVTIGRIEVRVGPPPAPAGAAAGAAKDRPLRPQPSRLEDYLRARGSGRIG